MDSQELEGQMDKHGKGEAEAARAFNACSKVSSDLTAPAPHTRCTPQINSYNNPLTVALQCEWLCRVLRADPTIGTGLGLLNSNMCSLAGRWGLESCSDLGAGAQNA